MTERRLSSTTAFYAQRQRDLAFRKKLYYGGQLIHSDPKVPTHTETISLLLLTPPLMPL